MSDKRSLLLETAAHVLEAAGGSMPITTLNKALFYVDLFALRDLGRSITHTTYIALPAGPVVAKYDKRLVAALEDEGIAQQDISEDNSKPVCLISAPPSVELDSEQLALVQRIAKWASRRTATELSTLSHQNEGWAIAWNKGLGARKPAQPINMRIGMQQILDVDPWVDQLPEGEVANAFADADFETGDAF